MKKIIIVDGNNLLFRSYYATSYSGVIMRILMVFLLMVYMVLLI